MNEAQAVRAFEEALRTQKPAFGEFFLAKLLGFRIEYHEDSSDLRFEVSDFMFNPQGSLHGGVIALALDVSMGHLIKHTMGRPGITLEMKTQYLRPAVSGIVRCEGRFLRRGRSINYLESRMTDQGGKLLAMATSTWQLLAEKPA